MSNFTLRTSTAIFSLVGKVPLSLGVRGEMRKAGFIVTGGYRGGDPQPGTPTTF